MFMPKQPLSVTLDRDNLVWLRGRAASRKRRSLSEALDELITQARLGGLAGDAPRSVIGTVDIAADDLGLERADEYLRGLIGASVARPTLVRERPPAPKRARVRRRG